MSSGPPPPNNQQPTGATLDDAVQELREIGNLLRGSGQQASPSGKNPIPPGGGALDELLREIRELVKVSQANLSYSQAAYFNSISQSSSGGAGGNLLTQHPTAPFGMPERWHGVEGWLRFSQSGMQTAAETTRSVFGRSRTGRWLLGKHKVLGNRTIGQWAKSKVRRTSIRLFGRRGTQAIGSGIDTVQGVVMAFIKVRDAVDRFTESALAKARQLSEVSGSMAGVTAEREIRQMMRDVKRGEETAGTARKLMESEDKRKTQEDRISIVFENATNRILAWGNDKVAGVLEEVADGVEWIGDLLMDEEKAEPTGLASVLPDVMKEAERTDAAGRDLMAIARASALAGGAIGAPSPANPAPMGRLP